MNSGQWGGSRASRQAGGTCEPCYLLTVPVRPQVFENVERMTVEAHYVFPIDAGAAVNGLEIKVDGRVIKGVVREKEEAKRA